LENDQLENRSMGLAIIFGAILLILYIATNGTRGVQQQSPGYNGNTWQTITITTDSHNSTDVCVGWCPDYNYEYKGR